ncbi:MAG: ATP-binding cassette domain-containing protein [Pseudomonadota bacterium]|nr:ATP-binding cassette domain-containing protein [Pseudomonadota bacterium]
MLLAIDNISYGYGGAAPVLAGFSLRLTSGQHSLLLGPSGSGKTTLINLIAGLLTPQSGSIIIAGESMSAAGPTARDDLRRRRIGIVFQSLRLVSAIDLRGNLALAQRLSGRGRDVAAIDALIERLGISHRAKAHPRDLSQGEAQRAAIARALVGKPDLLIADEPTSALDDANMERVARLLIDTANANGSTLLIATHDARLRAFIPETIALDRLKQAA